jgi:RNA polymerase sigma-70 factor (ECF subfamily)
MENQKTQISEADVNTAYMAHFAALRARCTQILRDSAEAEDVVQEGFVRLWSHRESVKERGALKSWLYTTVTRLAIERRKRGQRQVVSEHLDMKAADDSHRRDTIHQLEARGTLRLLQQKLPGAEQSVTCLSKLYGHTHDEIAAKMGVSDRTVRRILTRVEEKFEAIGASAGVSLAA